MLQDPLISIITVTYNAEATVAATMQSVASQSFDDYEHIVIDGVSTDRTLALVDELKSERTRVFSSPDHGIYDAMNKGLGSARGKYVVFLNAGDRFHSPDTLATVAEASTGKLSPGVIYGQTDLVDADGNFIAKRHLTAPEHLDFKSFRHGMLVCHQAFFVLRQIAPLYRMKWRYSADYDWCIRCLQHSRLNKYTGKVLVDYLLEGTTTQNRKASLKERFKIMSYYYGLIPTVLRHMAFVPRFIAARVREKMGKK